ncbi:MAG: SURF1 family protein [Acidimicrobiales bacterium]
MANARYLLRPRWLLSHLLVVMLIVAMVSLGLWQLRRLDERRERNDLIRDRQEEPVAPVTEVLQAADGDDAVAAARYRAVTATGRYAAADTVVVRNRTQDGVPGAWLVTPLVLADGDVVGVVRGFVRLGDDGDPLPVPVPDGELTVTGVVLNPDGIDGTGPRDLEPLLDQPETLPALVLSGDGAESHDDLAAVPLPELSEGPHFSYAVQWFIFAAIALIGYPLVLARVVRRRGKEVDDPVDADDLDRELDDLLPAAGNDPRGAR